MRIVFVTREGYRLAGARKRCYDLAKEVQKYGLKTEVLSFADCLGAKSGKEEYGLKLKEKLKYNFLAFEKLRKKKETILFINRFHYHSFAPWILSILSGTKIIFDMDDWEISENPKYYFGIWPTSKAEFLTRQIAKKATVCIGASKFLIDYLSRFNKKTYYIPSGVDIEKFKPQKIKKDNSKITFSWIGTMHRKNDIKNINFIIDCFLNLKRKYGNIYLEIAGDGIYRSSIKKDEYEDENIIFKGWIHPDKIPEYLNRIDIGLVPLIQDTKFNKAKSPAKLFEYMAMGKPTVSSNKSELAKIIEDGKNGLLAEDKENFIRSMHKLIIEKSLSNKLGHNAREYVCRYFSLQILSKKLYKVINSI